MMHFREDARRPQSVPDEVVEKNFNNINWADGKPNRLDTEGVSKGGRKRIYAPSSNSNPEGSGLVAGLDVGQGTDFTVVSTSDGQKVLDSEQKTV